MQNQAALRIKARFAPRKTSYADDCECADERLMVREAMLNLLDGMKAGFVIARCAVCNKAWLVKVSTGEKIAIVE